MQPIINIMRKGLPYTRVTTDIVNYLKESHKKEFTLKDFPNIDSREWLKTIERLRTNGFINRSGIEYYEGGAILVIWRDAHLVKSYERFCEQHDDWEE